MPDSKNVTDSPPIVERRFLVAFALVTCLFFSWALANNLNDVLIRHFQKALELTRTQSSLVQVAFYVGYFCAAIPAGLVIRRLGYKSTILVGLALYATGAFLFYPAAQVQEYVLFLAALYIIAFGLAFLETAANPYISILGDPRTASSRLNLAQAFNGLGAFVAPALGGLFIFSGVEYTKEQLAAMPAAEVAAWRANEALTVQTPYLVIGVFVLVLAAAIAVTRFPAIERPLAERAERRPFFSVLRHRTVVAAVVAQFFYVGAQVGIWSFFIDFTKDLLPQEGEKTVAFWLSASIALLMIGRFTGSWLQTKIAPTKLLLIYAIANIILCAAAVTLSGAPAVFALWLTSFFMSIMFPTIFALGVSGLGDETENASSFIIMSIIGGALIPPVMGLVSESFGGVHHMMIVPMICFVAVAVFAWWAHSAGLVKGDAVSTHG